MFDYISKAFYGTAMNGCGATACEAWNGAETGKINPTQAHELIGMVRLAMVCGECEPLDKLVMCLEQSALQQWKDRYACKPDADFDKAVRLLARYIRRHA